MNLLLIAFLVGLGVFALLNAWFAERGPLAFVRLWLLSGTSYGDAASYLLNCYTCLSFYFAGFLLIPGFWEWDPANCNLPTFLYRFFSTWIAAVGVAHGLGRAFPTDPPDDGAPVGDVSPEGIEHVEPGDLEPGPDDPGAAGSGRNARLGSKSGNSQSAEFGTYRSDR